MSWCMKWATKAAKSSTNSRVRGFVNIAASVPVNTEMFPVLPEIIAIAKSPIIPEHIVL